MVSTSHNALCAMVQKLFTSLEQTFAAPYIVVCHEMGRTHLEAYLQRLKRPEESWV
jgi:hypothetical protein